MRRLGSVVVMIGSLIITVSAQNTWGGKFITMNAMKGKSTIGHQGCYTCTGYSEPFATPFQSGIACIPYTTYGFLWPSGFSDGTLTFEAEGQSVMRVYFLLGTGDVPVSFFETVDPVAFLRLPSELVYEGEGLAEASAALFLPNLPCAEAAVSTSIGEVSIDARTTDCRHDDSGSYQRNAIRGKLSVPLNWKFLGHRRDIDEQEHPIGFSRLDGVVWMAEFLVDFESRGKWLSPLQRIGIECIPGGITQGLATLNLCCTTEVLWLHLMTYRKGTNGERIPNAYGEGDIGVRVISHFGVACIHSVEHYKPEVVDFGLPASHGGMNGGFELEWGHVMSSVPVQVTTRDLGGGMLVIHRSDNIPIDCLEVTNPPKRRGLLGEYTVPLTAVSRRTGEKIKTDFTMRVHLPVEVERVIAAEELSPRYHGYPVAVARHNPYSREVTFEVVRGASFLHEWGLGAEFGIESKAGIGGNVTGVYSEAHITELAHSVSYTLDPPPPGHRYVLMVLPRTYAEKLLCNHYDRTGYTHETEKCFWKIITETGVVFRDGEVITDPDVVMLEYDIALVPDQIGGAGFRDYLMSLRPPVCIPEGGRP